MTPYESDFVGPIQPIDVCVKGMSHKNTACGVGRVRWKMSDEFGNSAEVDVIAYYIPESEIRLFSPQQYFQQVDGGAYIVRKNDSMFFTADGNALKIRYSAKNNLSLVEHRTRSCL